jgi:hypothetical protein
MSRRESAAVLGPFFAGLLLMAVGQAVGVRALTGAGAALAALGAAVHLLRGQARGVLKTNWGTVRRDGHRLGFRVEIAFWWAVLAARTLAGAAYAFGRIGGR